MSPRKWLVTTCHVPNVQSRARLVSTTQVDIALVCSSSKSPYSANLHKDSLQPANYEVRGVTFVS